MRSPRLPNSTASSLPISFSYQVHKSDQRVQLIIEAPEYLSATLLDGLRLFEHFAQQAKRTIEAGYRDLRTQATLTDLEAQYATIRQAYHALRASGSKHRAAVLILVADESLPFHGNWSFSDFNWCIRTIPTSPPVLHAVPLSREKGCR